MLSRKQIQNVAVIQDFETDFEDFFGSWLKFARWLGRR